MSYAATRVFWDVEDFPIPSGLKLGRFDEKIQTALKHVGYISGPMSFNVYSDRKNVSRAFWHQFSHLGMYLNHDGEKRLRLKSMTTDIVLWATNIRYSYSNLPINLMVISKSIPEDRLLVRVLEAMKERGCNIFLAQHDEDDDSDESLATATEVWLWESLFEGGEPMEYVTDTDTDTEE